MKKTTLCCCAALLLTGCMTAEMKVRHQATTYGFTHHQITSNGFLLTVFRNHSACNNNQQHIYIAGDGNPWWHHNQIAINPTPSHLLILDLMSLDHQSSLYLGRPCYHGQHHSEACHPLYWTHWRYSPTIVKTMVSALQQLLEAYPKCHVTLIGYSGGGALVMLMAPKLPRVQRVITISGNLDIAAWARHHHYSLLDGSLNPATEPALPPGVIQIHLIGDDDNNIPSDIILSVLKSQPNPVILRFPDADHDCCWVDIWPDIINRLVTGYSSPLQSSERLE